MRNNKYLILDTPYLCHRAKHTTGGLSYDNNATGIIYSLLRSLSGYQDYFNTSNFIFCWDSKTSKRKEIYPEYKANRVQEVYTEEEIALYRAFKKQMKNLRITYLPMIGFKNNFIQKGYESDDIIASICNELSNKDEAVIIASDKDLYQCIAHNISLYNPQTNKILTLQGFKKKYGIEPIRWGLVKSYAGCTTDNVKGIKGVGEKIAAKYILNELNKSSKIYKEIKSSRSFKIFERNRNLVILPMVGTKKFKLKKDELSEDGWTEVCRILGMKSIRDKMPFGRKINKNIRRK